MGPFRQQDDPVSHGQQTPGNVPDHMALQIYLMAKCVGLELGG